jgi:hypothetical protein
MTCETALKIGGYCHINLNKGFSSHIPNFNLSAKDRNLCAFVNLFNQILIIKRTFGINTCQSIRSQKLLNIHLWCDCFTVISSY